MRKTFVIHLILILLLGSLATLSAYAANTGKISDSIQIVPRDGSAELRNHHPLKITPQRLIAALEGLRLIPASKRVVRDEDSIALFSAEGAEDLGRALAGYFRRVRPDEDIVFQIVDTKPLFGKLLDKDIVITGRVFWYQSRLNIIFGSVHHRPKKRWMLGRVVGTSNPPEFPARNKISSLKYRVAQVPGIEYAKLANGKIRPDWIKINLNEFIDEEDTTAPAPMKKKAPVSSEARLRKLKALRDEGLISERQYQEKVREILDQL